MIITTTPEIGVCVPTWNSGVTLDWTLLALRRQRGCVVRVVVADSGSRDDTLDICARWGVDSIYVPPGNMYRAINAGLRTLDTEWLAYLNSDDVVYADTYARLIQQGRVTGADVVYGHADYVDGDGRFLHTLNSSPPALLSLLHGRGEFGIPQPSAIFRRELYEALRGFGETYKHNADFDFYARAVQEKRKFARLARPSVCAFRLHETQLSKLDATGAGKESAQIRALFAPRPSLPNHAAFWAWRFSNLGNYLLRVLRIRAVTWR